MKEINALIVCLVIYVIAEASWLFSATSFYSREFSSFSKEPLGIQSPIACILVYPLIVSSFYFFVLKNNRRQQSLGPVDMFLRGAFFGIAVYGIYNLTNRATMKDYSWMLVAVDTLWGATLFGFIAVVFSACSPNPEPNS